MQTWFLCIEKERCVAGAVKYTVHGGMAPMARTTEWARKVSDASSSLCDLIIIPSSYVCLSFEGPDSHYRARLIVLWPVGTLQKRTLITPAHQGAYVSCSHLVSAILIFLSFISSKLSWPTTTIIATCTNVSQGHYAGFLGFVNWCINKRNISLLPKKSMGVLFISQKKRCHASIFYDVHGGLAYNKER